MRCALLLTVVAAVVVGLAGCACPPTNCGPACMTGTCADAPETCASCSAGCSNCTDPSAVARDPFTGRPRDPFGGGCRLGDRRWREPFNPGPPAGAITYPYYTTHGPRDFLASNPRPLGP